MRKNIDKKWEYIYYIYYIVSEYLALNFWCKDLWLLVIYSYKKTGYSKKGITVIERTAEFESLKNRNKHR